MTSDFDFVLGVMSDHPLGAPYDRAVPKTDPTLRPLFARPSGLGPVAWLFANGHYRAWLICVLDGWRYEIWGRIAPQSFHRWFDRGHPPADQTQHTKP